VRFSIFEKLKVKGALCPCAPNPVGKIDFLAWNGTVCVTAHTHFFFFNYRYVAQFSRSLYVEYRSKGIDVQCQVN
jgi:hypothetical protein